MTLESYLQKNEESEQTAIVHLVNPKTNVEVDLVSTSHIGKPGYYEEIRERLGEADVVLYESGSSFKKSFYDRYSKAETAHQGRIINKAIKKMIKSHPVKREIYRSVGEKLKERVKLISQTRAIDYDNLPKSWISSDLDSRELIQKLSGKSLFKLWLIEIAGKISSLPNFLGGGRLREYRNKTMSEFLESPEGLKINRERERTIYEQLSKTGKKPNVKKVGVLYGALHMPFIEQILIQNGYIYNNEKGIDYLTYKLTPNGALREIKNL